MAHPRMYDDSNPTIGRLRQLCLALPGTVEKEAWGECTFRVERGSMFAMTNNGPEHGGRCDVWIKAAPLEQEILIGAAPKTFFKPPYLGHKGWIGVRLDGQVDWQQVAELLQDGHRMSAPQRMQKSTPVRAKRSGAGDSAKRIAPAARRKRGS